MPTPTPNEWNPNTTLVWSNQGSQKEIPIERYDEFIGLGWGATAPSSSPPAGTPPATPPAGTPSVPSTPNAPPQDTSQHTVWKDGKSTVIHGHEVQSYLDRGYTNEVSPTVQPLKPTGNAVNDQHIEEVNQIMSETPQLFTTSTYEPTLLEIYEARPDVQEEAERLFPGQNPTEQGTEANKWLNDWYNQYGKAEGADMVAQGILGETTETGTPKVNTTDVENTQAVIDEAVRLAMEAQENKDYTALKEAMEDLKIAREEQQTALDQLYENQKKFREQYLESLKPTAVEEDLQSQLVNIRAEIDQVELNAKAGIDKVTQQAIPQAFVTGQSKAIANAANLTLQTQAKLEKNLIDRLGIEVGKRKTVAEGAAAMLGFISSDLQVQEQIATRLQNQENTLIDRFEKYENKQKEDAADILQALSGIDPNELSPQAMSQILNIASQLGLSPTDIIAGLQLQYDQYVLEKAKQQAALEPGTTIFETGGKQLLINSSTGEIIKELGAVEQRQFAPSSRSGTSEPDKTIKWSQDVEDAGLAGQPQWMLDDILNLTSSPPWFDQLMEEEFQMSKDWQGEWTEKRNKVVKIFGEEDEEEIVGNVPKWQYDLGVRNGMSIEERDEILKNKTTSGSSSGRVSPSGITE